MAGSIDGTILPATSGHQIHPPQQVLEARVVEQQLHTGC